MKKNIRIPIPKKFDKAFELCFLKSLFVWLFLLTSLMAFGQSDGDYRSAKNGGGWASAGTFDVYSSSTDTWTLNKGIWVKSTAYTAGTQVVNGTNLYTCASPGTSAASGGPTGAGIGITDGSVTWNYTGIAASVPTSPTSTTNVTIMDGVLQTSNGNGYVAGSLTVGQGNAFSGTVVLTGTAVSSVTINNPGKLMANPGIIFIGAGTTAATGTLTFFADGTYYRSKGNGYTGTETVTIGTAWAPNTVYAIGNQRSNSGSLYTCTTAGTSEASGGPTGTGTGIIDGGVTWNYAGIAATAHPIFSSGQITDIVIDNVGSGYTSFPGLTISGSSYTNWVLSTAYNVGEQRIIGYNVYTCTGAGTSSPNAGPTGTGTGIIDGTAMWDYTRSIASYVLQMGVGSVVITNGGNYATAPQVMVGSAIQLGKDGTAKTVTIYGDVTFKNGANLYNGGTSSLNTNLLNIGGNLIAETPISCITSVLSSTCSTIINFNKTGNATISGAGSITFNNLTVNNNTTTLINNSSGTITIQGNSNWNYITAFDLATPATTGIISQADSTVTLYVPGGTDVTSLVPTVTLFAGGSVDPLSGVAQDFTNPKIYTVTAKNGISTKHWKVTVNVGLSTNATLSALSVAGYALSPAFIAGTLEYSISLPYGTVIDSNFPAVNYTAVANATAIKTDVAVLPGTTTIDVTAQDGITKKTYKINFNVAAPSNDATLSSLTLSSGTLSPAFSSGTFTYNVVLPNGSSDPPTVNYTPAANATASITNPSVLPGASTILVTAQDGITTNVYTINFSVAAAKVSQAISMTLPTLAYGDTDAAIGATATSTLPVTYASSNLKIVTIVNGKIHVLNAGTSNITASQSGNINYFPAPDVQQTLTVNKAKLTVTIHDTIRLRGTANPVFKMDYSGFIGTDNIDSLATIPTDSCIANAYSPVGDYDINITGGLDNNYDFICNTGKLSVRTTLGVETTTEKHVLIFPNPVQSFVNISGLPPKSTIGIYSISGELLWKTKTLKDFTGIDMREFAAGIYIIKVVSSDNNIVKQIVKQ